MGKIYLKKVPEEIYGSCKGCYFYKGGETVCGKHKICCMIGDHIIFKQIFPEEDREISYSHKTYDGPGVQGCRHNVPMGATTGTSGVSGSLTDTVCGTPRTGNENMLICHVCKQMRPKEDFKVIYINAPAQIIIAYACRTCGYIRIKPEDLKD